MLLYEAEGLKRMADASTMIVIAQRQTEPLNIKKHYAAEDLIASDRAQRFWIPSKHAENGPAVILVVDARAMRATLGSTTRARVRGCRAFAFARWRPDAASRARHGPPAL